MTKSDCAQFVVQLLVLIIFVACLFGGGHHFLISAGVLK